MRMKTLYPVDTPVQLRAVLRALRLQRALTQEQAGKLLGVNQRRAAKIEGNPAVTGFGQISRLVSALGGRIVIEIEGSPATTASATNTKKSASAKLPSGEW